MHWSAGISLKTRLTALSGTIRRPSATFRMAFTSSLLVEYLWIKPVAPAAIAFVTASSSVEAVSISTFVSGSWSSMFRQASTPVLLRHYHVHDDDIGVEFLRFPDGLLSVCCQCHDFECF